MAILTSSNPAGAGARFGEKITALNIIGFYDPVNNKALT